MTLFLGRYRVHGSVLSSGARLRYRAAGEDHRRIFGSIPVVRGRQTSPLPQLDQAERQRATSTLSVQVVPGHKQPGERLGHIQRRMRGDGGDQAGEAVREDRSHAAQQTAETHRGSQHRRLHDGEEQHRHQLQGYEPHQQLRTDTWTPVRLFHRAVLRSDIGYLGAG